MEILNWKGVEEITVKEIGYKGTMNEVKGISLRWLSKTGEDDKGLPEYGLRFLQRSLKERYPFITISTFRLCLS